MFSKFFYVFKKKIALSIVLNYLLCYGISFNPVAMDRSLSPGTIRTLCSFHGENSLGEIKDSIKTINDEHGIKQYSYRGKKYILKSNKYYYNYMLEKMAGKIFENKPREGVCAPFGFGKYSYSLDDKKYYSISPYIENVDEHTLFKFINYSDYKEGTPSKLRTFDERKNMWIDLASQLINIITCLSKDYKILYCDWKHDNVLFNIDDKNSKLIVTLIDFDAICEVECASQHDSFKCDLSNFCSCLMKNYLLPMFYGCDKSYDKNNKFCLDLDGESDDYFLNIDFCLEPMCRHILEDNPPKTIEEYSSYVDNLTKVLIDGEKIY